MRKTQYSRQDPVTFNQRLIEALASGGAEAERAFTAMMTMQKIDVAAIDAARKGQGID